MCALESHDIVVLIITQLVYFGIVDVPVLRVGVSLHLFYTFIHIYAIIHRDYKLACMGNEKDLETTRLAMPAFFQCT